MSTLDTALSTNNLVSIGIEPLERQYALSNLVKAAAVLDLPIYYWSVLSSGLQPVAANEPLGNFQSDDLSSISHGERYAIDSILTALNPQKLTDGLYVYLDLFAAIDALEASAKVKAHQAIVDLYFALKTTSKVKAIFMGTERIPHQFYNLIHSYSFPLPTTDRIVNMLEGANLPSDGKFLNILSGLTVEEINAAIDRVPLGADLDTAAERLLGYKYSLFAAYGLEFIGDTATKDIGGLDLVKKYLVGVEKSFSPQARKYNIPIPRGCLLVGVPGTGKTYFAKFCAQKLGFPLINIGIDVVKSQGIDKFKQLLKRIDACEPCIPYFDEFDKFFMGENSGEFLGVILTWLNEKTSKTFVIATLNRLENLPPELTRAGRFDRTFYVDFPKPAERKEILQLHCARFDDRYHMGDGPLTPKEWMSILARTDKCTGQS